MANIFLSYPNYADAGTQITPVLGGGDWAAALPLANLQHRLLSRVARSSDTAADSTLFHVDLGTQRDIRRVVIPRHNLSRSALARVRASRTVAWSGVTLSSSPSGGASSFDVAADGVTLTEGDPFTIAGDDTVYRATATLAGSGTLSISPPLASAHTSGQAVTCRRGSFSTPLLDSGWFEVWPVIYPFGTLPWGSAGVWDGKLSEEDRSNYPIPLRVTTELINARYLLVEIDDTGNADGYVELARLFVSKGFQPGRNFRYDATLGWASDTQVKKSAAGAEYYDTRPPYRQFNCTLEYLEDDEAYTYVLDMQNKLNREGQLYVEIDPEATTHLHRTAMLATLGELTPLGFSFHGRKTAVLPLKEVIA